MELNQLNLASQWRLELARRITPLYEDNSDVYVVEIGGSVSHGCADRYSDIEIGVFWCEPPSEAERRDIAVRAGGTAWRGFEFADDEWREEFIYHGVKIDVCHRLVSSMESWLEDVVLRYDTSTKKQNLIAAILQAIPVCGERLLEEWQAKARAYPNGLADAMVREHLYLGPQHWLEILAERGSILELYEIFCRIEKRLLGILMGLNHMYHPGFKWQNRLTNEFSIAPMEFGERLNHVFQADLLKGVAEIGLLITETYNLVDKFMPHIDTAPARERVNQRRPVWDGAPR